MVLSAAAKASTRARMAASIAASTRARMAARIAASKSRAQVTDRIPRVRKSLTHSQISQQRGAGHRYGDRRAQRHIDAEQDMERRIDSHAGRSGGTPGWYKSRKEYRERTEKPVLTRYTRSWGNNGYIFAVDDQFGNRKVRGMGARKSIFDARSEAIKKGDFKLTSSNNLFRRLNLKKRDT